jgi:3-hydroxyacyl-[acyl-carrier-protein] dehydratase
MHFSIAPTHPALEGHFPGQPIVPAVVILDEVLAAVSRTDALGPVAGVIQAKFTAVLRPGQRCSIEFAAGINGLRFTCRAEGQTIASGLLALAAGTP